MERRRFTREFKLEAVKLVRERGVSYTQASQDLGVHQTQLRHWVKAFTEDPAQACGTRMLVAILTNKSQAETSARILKPKTNLRPLESAFPPRPMSQDSWRGSKKTRSTG